MKARVYFTESDRSFWLKRFLQPGFSHCHITVKVGYREILINPASHYTYIGLSDGAYAGQYVDIEIDEPERKARTIWEVNSCVTQIKNFAGIRKYGIFTPYQLYRYLKHGVTLQKAESA